MRNGYLIPLIVGATCAATLVCLTRHWPHGGRYRGSDWVRSAGRREMRNAPRNWDMTDERADESFPASDPPATY